MRVGRLQIGPDVLPLDADSVYLFDVGGTLAAPLVVGSLVLYLDGLGAGSGEQRMRPAVMEADDPATLVLGDEVVVVDGQAAGWVHMTFDLPPTIRAGVEPRIGVATGPASGLARLAVEDGHAGVSERYDAVYDEPVVVLGAGTDVDSLATVAAIGVAPWAPPAGLTEEDLAELPIDVVQRTLDGSAASVVEPAICGWHYSNDSPPPPASAIVRTGGPLEQLVGERVRITAASPIGPASVIVVVVDEQPFDVTIDEDISLSRDAFARVAGLWADAVPARVEVIA